MRGEDAEALTGATGKSYSARADKQDFGCLHGLLYIISLLLVAATFPFSLCLILKIVPEYRSKQPKKKLTLNFAC